MIDISKLDKAAVLAALYNNSKQQGMGFLQARGRTGMTIDEAKELLTGDDDHYFDYLHGRVMKVDLSGDQLNEYLYDRDNGAGAAQQAINTVK